MSDKLDSFMFWYGSSPFNVVLVIGLMWGIAFILVPIVQIIQYHIDCKKYGKEYTDELYRRM